MKYSDINLLCAIIINSSFSLEWMKFVFRVLCKWTENLRECRRTLNFRRNNEREISSRLFSFVSVRADKLNNYGAHRSVSLRYNDKATFSCLSVTVTWLFSFYDGNLQSLKFRTSTLLIDILMRSHSSLTNIPRGINITSLVWHFVKKKKGIKN